MVEPQPANTSELADCANPEAHPIATPVVMCSVKPDGVPSANSPGDGGSHPLSFQQSLRPVLQGIEAVARAQFEQVEMLDRVEKVMMHQTGVPKILAETKVALEQRNAVSKAMFEALHAELKTYKDAFLLEAVLRPVIRDLISLYDDISDIHRQLALGALEPGAARHHGGKCADLFRERRGSGPPARTQPRFGARNAGAAWA